MIYYARLRQLPLASRPNKTKRAQAAFLYKYSAIS